MERVGEWAQGQVQELGLDRAWEQELDRVKALGWVVEELQGEKQSSLERGGAREGAIAAIVPKPRQYNK
jgi:hypothetical protein